MSEHQQGNDEENGYYSDEHIVYNMDEFYGIINGTTLPFMDPKLLIFKEAYERINVGCGCQKKSRILGAKHAYKDLNNIDVSVQLQIKRSLQAYNVFLKDEGETVASYVTQK